MDALDLKSELIWNSYRARDVERRAFFREVPDRAVDRAATEFD